MLPLVRFGLRTIANQSLAKFNAVPAAVSSKKMSSLSDYNFETLKVTSPKEYVYQVELNRPEKLNSMNKAFWREMKECFNKVAMDPDCRAVVLSGAGRLFTAGLDLADAADLLGGTGSDIDGARKGFVIRQVVADFQSSFTAIEKCLKPVVAAVHNACIGGGVDMISACDIRYCSQDTYFSIKEIDLGIVADVGTLQRLPKIVGNDGLVRELAYTGRKLMADEAKQFGLVSRILPDREATISSAIETASLIASKSPVAIQGVKANLIYSRDHNVPESLDYVGTWNASMLQTEDVMKAASASMQKTTPTFSKL